MEGMNCNYGAARCCPGDEPRPDTFCTCEKGKWICAVADILCLGFCPDPKPEPDGKACTTAGEKFGLNAEVKCCGSVIPDWRCTCDGSKYSCTQPFPPGLVCSCLAPVEGTCPATKPGPDAKCNASTEVGLRCDYDKYKCCGDKADRVKTVCGCQSDGSWQCSDIGDACAPDAFCPDAPKTSWPELIGKTCTEAKAIIEKENPALNQVVCIPPGSFVTADFRTDRVRISTDSNGLVSETPTIG